MALPDCGCAWGFQPQLWQMALLMLIGPFDTIDINVEGSHSGRVRAPAKRLTRESGFMGSNPIPSAT